VKDEYPVHAVQSKLVKLWPGLGSRAGFMEKQKAEAWSLVLLSVNITHRMIQSHRGWEILVNELDAVAARHHLEQYEAENNQWPPVVKYLPHSKPIISKWTILFGALLTGFFALTGPWSESSWFFERGAIHSGAVKEQFQWWRVVTALTLHADIVHLFGNVCLGGVLLAFLSGLTGSGTAWLLAVLAGSIGNMLNVLFRAGIHNSVGFSTAVFGVIGAFCGIRAFREGFINILLPLGAGLGLLAMLGTGGERTDIGAHVWGLLSGMGLGGIYYFIDPRIKFAKDKRLQNILATVTLLWIFIAWAFAWPG
jgi:membrane associated rhomboid family serine protease